MAETSRNPVVLEACGAEGRQAQLQALSEQLQACQKSLSEYIELKRCAFTRCVIQCTLLSSMCNQPKDMIATSQILRGNSLITGRNSVCADYKSEADLSLEPHAYAGSTSCQTMSC